jgi:hypothetical protein
MEVKRHEREQFHRNGGDDNDPAFHNYAAGTTGQRLVPFLNQRRTPKIGMREFEEKRIPRPVKLGLALGAALFFVVGLLAGLLLQLVSLGVLLFALGAILFAVRGYLNTGDKVVAGTLIFVAVVAVGIQAVVYLLGP